MLSNGFLERIWLFKNKCGSGDVLVMFKVICVTIDIGRGGGEGKRR